MTEKIIKADNIFEKVSEIINQSRQSVANAINTELVLLYWNIGRIIKIEILQNEKAEYGTQKIESLSSKLVAEYGRGYSTRNLFNMIKFYEFLRTSKFCTQ